MENRTLYKFNPDYAVAPGETLLETIQSLGMKQAELAERTGLSKKHINGIIKGKEPITPETALCFESVFGVPASFWNNLEKNYREQLARINRTDELKPLTTWLNEFPISAMIKIGWIKQGKNETHQMKILLGFFGVAGPDQWRKIWVSPQAVFRSSTAFKSKPGSISAWLRKGELKAQEVKEKPYNRGKFIKAQSDIRALTLKTDPKIFLNELERICADCGVAVVLVPELPGTCVYGATRWVAGRPIIQLSLRYKTHDHLWFTFFHEAGHILLHGRKEVFLEGMNKKTEKEEEADKYSQNLLIPEVEFKKFIQIGDCSRLAVESFSKKLKIAPGILVGRLNHDGKVPYNQLNELKGRYERAKNN